MSMPLKQPARKAPAVSLLVVLAALLFTTACGDESMPAVPTPTVAVVDKSPTSSTTPAALEQTRPSPTEVVSAGPAVSASTDVVTEEDLLNTTHPLEGTLAPELTGIEAWIGSDPVTLASLQGKIILIDFWTYSCINCIRTLRSSSNAGEVRAARSPHHRRPYARVRLRERRRERQRRRRAVRHRLSRCAGQRSRDVGRIRRHRVACQVPHRRRGSCPLRRGRGGRLRRHGADDPPLARTGRRRRILSSVRAGRLPPRPGDRPRRPRR